MNIITISERRLLAYPLALWLLMGLANAYNYETTTCANSDGTTNVRWTIDMNPTGRDGRPIDIFVNHGDGETNFAPDTITTNFQNIFAASEVN